MPSPAIPRGGPIPPQGRQASRTEDLQMIDTRQDARVEDTRVEAGQDHRSQAGSAPVVKRVPRSPYVMPSSVADAGRVRVGGV